MPNEPQPEQAKAVPPPPPFLDPYAAAEWQAVAPELFNLGLLTKLDTMTLAAYCMSYATWRKAAEALARMEANDPITHGQLIRTRYGDAAINPLVSIARKAAGDMVRCASEFGIGPMARARLAAGGFEPSPAPGKFSGLLGSVVPLRPRDDESR